MAQTLNGKRDHHDGSDYLAASREGRGLCLKVNDKAGTNAADTVLTDAGLLYAIPTGEQAVLTCFYLYLSTASDWVWCELGYTANADGSGTFTALTPKFRVDTGAAREGASPSVTGLNPPIIVKDTTAGAVTARVRTNDAGATFTLALNGWHERY